MDAWIDGWMDGWMDGWTDGRMDRPDIWVNAREWLEKRSWGTYVSLEVWRKPVCVCGKVASRRVT